MPRRVSRRVLEMDDGELCAVIAVAMPGRKVEELRKDEKQEICMKWLFGNDLSMNHIFTFEKEDDDVFVLMSNKKACSCCTKDVDTVTIRNFDRTPIGSSLAVYKKDGDTERVEVKVGDADRPSSTTPPKTATTLQPPGVHKSKSDSSFLSASTLGRQKIQPITSQPKAIHFEAMNKEKEEPEPNAGCCKSFWREYGQCCVSLWYTC